MLTEDPKYKEFFNVIDIWLTIREHDPTAYDIEDSEIGCNYVRGMLNDLNKLIPESDKIDTYDAIRRADTAASGHIDYPNKFALYCTEIYYNVLKIEAREY